MTKLCIRCNKDERLSSTALYCKKCTVRGHKIQERNGHYERSKIADIRIGDLTLSASALNHPFFDTMSVGDQVLTRMQYLKNVIRGINEIIPEKEI